MCESSERDGFVEKLCSASFGVPPHWICTSFGFELSDENMIHEGVEKHSANKKNVVFDVELSGCGFQANRFRTRNFARNSQLVKAQSYRFAFQSMERSFFQLSV